ncbi:helix-turn-helix domain-containing protein [Chitinophaga sp. GCM10012297]|uniref:Helix-turn-helix transcriptional regulator n=1 Tax=Chitinophaga chungangae TaxID=2821488 RepID=A0ABS3Y9G7_9BACT|nr:XRE family transcriptional regulator [Chitinophaga chungangae]MBO9151323.1 helix-turn-helix transcriptional regulator [Chitinophaga chungangae]
MNQEPQQDAVNSGHLVYHRIGGLIRRYRKEKGLKLLDLSGVTGIKSAMLSKIENGRMLPTIPTLFTIIQKLGIKTETFFAELSAEHHFPGYILIPKDSYTPYEKEEGATGFEYQSILENNFEGGAFQISLLTLRPGAQRQPVTTAAYEYLYVLSGNLQYQLEDKTFDLSEGDSLFFDGNIAHVPVNSQKTTVKLLVMYFFGELNR